jgi:uncharacterized protein YjbJ (UPF0337 family)
MNQDIAQGKWKELSGKIKQKWGKLTDDDLTRAKGDKEYLVGKLHEQYGLAKDRVEDELQTLGYREDDQDVDLRSSERSAAGRMDAAGYSDAGSSRQDMEGGAGHTLEAAGSGQDSSSSRSSAGSSKPGSKAGSSMPDKSSPQKSNRNNPGGSSSRS